MPDADLYGFTQATILLAEGARVAVVSCETCGASLLLDPRETISVIDRHRAWHEGITIRSFQAIENERDELRAENERLREWINTEGRNCPSAGTIDLLLAVV